MKKALIFTMIFLVVAMMATTGVQAAEPADAYLSGSYTIEDGWIYYDIRLTADTICVLSFELEPDDLHITEIRIHNSVFQDVAVSNNKLIAYSFSNVRPNQDLLITVIMEVPASGQYFLNAIQVEAYTFSEETLNVAVDFPMIQIASSAPNPTQPAPTEPTEPIEPTEPKPSAPESSTPTPPTSQPQAGVDSSDTNQLVSAETARSETLSMVRANIQDFAENNPLVFGIICVVILIFVLALLFGGKSKKKRR